MSTPAFQQVCRGAAPVDNIEIPAIAGRIHQPVVAVRFGLVKAPEAGACPFRWKFPGEFPSEWAGSGLWRFNESEPDSNDRLMDSSGNGRDFNIINWSGTTANLLEGWRGHYFRFNINNPTSEKTYLQAVNDGSIFSSLGRCV